jgi:hypothetical protein
MTSSTWVNKVIQEGYGIIFNKPPPLRLPPLHNPFNSIEEQRAISSEVQSLLQKRAIEECNSGKGFYSRIFTIPKKTGDLRPVLNLRPLNQFINAPKFKMETLSTICRMLKPGDWLTSIDLSDAFLHVSVLPAHKKYLRFRWQNKYYQFRTLPFGLSLSPLVFTKILRPVLKWARTRGIRISAYLDDILIAASTKQEAEEHTRVVQRQLERLGFLIKESKSTMTPTQCIEHLGFRIDTRTMTLSVPRSKVRDLRREAEKLLRNKSTALRNLASFIGKAMAMTAAVFPARLMTRRLIQVQNRALANQWKWTAQVNLTGPALEELEWWRAHLADWNGQSFLPHKTDIDVYTDASDDHWGIVRDETTISRPWTEEEQDHHINWKELKVIWYLVHLSEMQGRSINVVCDNVTTIAHINRFGGTRSPILMDLTSDIWTHCLQTNTRLKTTYVPSAFNPADAPSRKMIAQLEWSIDATFFDELEEKWGAHSIDLFASRDNAKVLRFVSWKPDPAAVTHDSIRLSWTDMGRVYACPPWNLIPLVLQKIRQDKVQATVITPFWPSMLWFPTISAMATCKPLPIPRDKVLPAPGNSPHVLARNPLWSLAAWSVDGNKL